MDRSYIKVKPTSLRSPDMLTLSIWSKPRIANTPAPIGCNQQKNYLFPNCSFEIENVVNLATKININLVYIMQQRARRKGK